MLRREKDALERRRLFVAVWERKAEKVVVEEEEEGSCGRVEDHLEARGSVYV